VTFSAADSLARDANFEARSFASEVVEVLQPKKFGGRTCPALAGNLPGCRRIRHTREHDRPHPAPLSQGEKAGLWESFLRLGVQKKKFTCWQRAMRRSPGCGFVCIRKGVRSLILWSGFHPKSGRAGSSALTGPACRYRSATLAPRWPLTRRGKIYSYRDHAPPRATPVPVPPQRAFSHFLDEVPPMRSP